VELSRRVLQKLDLPPAGMPGNHQRLNRIDCRIKVSLPRQHHACDSAKDRDVGVQEAQLADLRYVSGGCMTGKDLLQRRLDFGSPVLRTAVESNHVAILDEHRGHTLGIALIPLRQHSVIERANFELIGHASGCLRR